MATTEELVGAARTAASELNHAMMRLRSIRVTCIPEIEDSPAGELNIWLNIFKEEKL